ncbi:MAG: phosphatase PAP2 family protein [Streptosporangiales bacterium]
MPVTKPHTAGREAGRLPRSTSGAEVTRFWLPTAARLALSLPGLVAVLIIMTALAIGPLQGFDQAFTRPWSDWYLPTVGPFLAEMVDPIASQVVAVPLMGIVAVYLAWQRWSWRPILAGSIGEFGTVAFVGAMKLGFARPSPVREDSGFFHGGLLTEGWHGISYPSGHAAEAVAFYGMIVFLVARFGQVSRRTVALLGAITFVIAVVTVTQSWYMEWHWVTDLVGGILAGGVVLRAAITADNVVPPRARALYERARARRRQQA